VIRNRQLYLCVWRFPLDGRRNGIGCSRGTCRGSPTTYQTMRRMARFGSVWFKPAQSAYGHAWRATIALRRVIMRLPRLV